jgi:hypothetical protein
MSRNLDVLAGSDLLETRQPQRIRRT